MSTLKEETAMAEASGLIGDHERIHHAAEAIRGMTVKSAQRRGFSDRRRQITIEAPLQSLAIAFLLGVLIARRR